MGFSLTNLNFLSRVGEKYHLLKMRQMEEAPEGAVTGTEGRGKTDVERTWKGQKEQYAKRSFPARDQGGSVHHVTAPALRTESQATPADPSTQRASQGDSSTAGSQAWECIMCHSVQCLECDLGCAC